MKVSIIFLLILFFSSIFSLETAFFEKQELIASDGNAGDKFGDVLSNYGNYTVVGAPYAKIGSNLQQGAAYVFFYDGNSWIQTQKLVAYDGLSYDNFGASVSIYGNYIVVGAPYKSNGNITYQGSTYVYFNNGSSWNFQQKLDINEQYGSYFGYCVLVYEHYLISSFYFSSSAVSVFYNTGSSWNFQQQIFSNEYLFVFSLSMYGNNLLIGAIGYNEYQGCSYIYSYNGSLFIQVQQLFASDGKSGDNFGLQVSIYGNYIIIGAYTATIGNNTQQGAAYVFYYNGISWIQTQKLVSSDGGLYAQFGSAVSMYGNYAIISAQWDTIGFNIKQGSAYIFYNNGGSWVQVQQLIAYNGIAFDEFGYWVSIYENYVLVGTFDTVGFNVNQGSVYFFLNEVLITTQAITTSNEIIIEYSTFSDTLLIGAIIGSVIAIALIILIFLLILLLRRRHRSTDERVTSIIEMELAQDYPAVPHENYSLIGKSLESEIKYSDIQKDSSNKILGRGAFGIVYKGKYKGQDVAVKEINGNIINPIEVDAFIQESELMRRLDSHPNVIQLIGITASPFCIVVEFMINGDLYKYIRSYKHSITSSQEVKWMIDICRGMCHLGSNNIVHRDLAARNCLLDRSLNIKISDFGLARISDDTKEIYSKGNVGPLKWMSVEALQKKKYSEKSDVWSFGITCIEILTKDNPYPGMSAIEASTQVAGIQGLRPIIPQNAHPKIRAILPQCWRQLPEERPTFQQILQQL